MFSDLSSVLVWWFALFGIGIIFLPLTNKLFSKLFDQGYLFSKVLGILFSTYLVWLLASLKISPFVIRTIVIVLVVCLLGNLFLLIKNKELFKNKRKIIIWVGEELIFFLALVFWSYIRALQPDIQGLEKFMDFGFVNSILRSKYFPPEDMWFAGKSINYYYFGHFITAFLTKLTGINSAITYNIMIATLYAFTFSLTFSLTGNLVYLWKKFSSPPQPTTRPTTHHPQLILIAGLISAFLISLGANLHPAYYNFKMSVLGKTYCDGATTYWYPNATRFIGYCPDVEDKTIHEFPSYSFIVSDLHGHVSDIPFVLLFLTFCLVLYLKILDKKIQNFSLKPLIPFFPLSLILAIMYMTNQWDFPIYLMVLGFVLLSGFYKIFGKNIKTLTLAVFTGGIILLLSIPLFLPFQLGFENIAKGIGFVRAHSLPYQLAVLWGGPWMLITTFLLFLYGKRLKFSFKKEVFLRWLSSRLGVEAKFKKTIESGEGKSKVIPFDIFAIILALSATILVFVPEIIYLKDIYIPSYHRANTMFKLTYQSFIMFSIISGYIIVRVISSLKSGLTKKALILFYSLIFFSLMVYPFYSIKGYYGKLSASNYKGLYGLKFLERSYPDDYQVVNWLNKNVKDQPVVLEAVGDSYTDYERISMATGLPTIEGWLVHEWLWRGSFDEPGKRSSEVQLIYESKDIDQTKELLKKYNVKYLVIGNLEREKYPNLDEKKLKTLGKVIFESNKTYLLELI